MPVHAHQEEPTPGAERIVNGSAEIDNRTNEPNKPNLECKDTVETRDSYEIGGSVGVDLFHVVDASVHG